LQEHGDDRLKGFRKLPLFNLKNLSEARSEQFGARRESTLAKGWGRSLQQLCRFFWHETDAVGGRAFFESC
jgi:hypothetical protein